MTMQFIIIASGLVLDLYCGKMSSSQISVGCIQTDRQTNRQTNSNNNCLKTNAGWRRRPLAIVS